MIDYRHEKTITVKAFWTIKGILFFFILLSFSIIFLWYGSVCYRKGADDLKKTHKGIQYEISGTPYCEQGGIYFQVTSFNPRGMTFKTKRGQ